MTLFIILFILSFILGFALASGTDESILVLIIPFACALSFSGWSSACSENHYLEPIQKSIEIQKAIVKEEGAFLLYKVEGEEEERAEDVSYFLTDKPSHLLITKPKPRVWWFINMASERETIYLNKEDLKKFL